MDDKHVAAEEMLKPEGGRSETMDFIKRCSPSHLQEVFAKCGHEMEARFQAAEDSVATELKLTRGLFQSAYGFLVDAFESIRSSLTEIVGSASPDWKQKVLDFVIDKTVDLIEYITGFKDEAKITAIVKCTVTYIVCVASAIAKN